MKPVSEHRLNNPSESISKGMKRCAVASFAREVVRTLKDTGARKILLHSPEKQNLDVRNGPFDKTRYLGHEKMRSGLLVQNARADSDGRRSSMVSIFGFFRVLKVLASG